MRSSFPWYDLPSVHWANDVLWQATGLAGDFDRDVEACQLWHQPDLLVTQACGLDLFLSDAPLEPVAVPVFDLDCDDGQYFSYVVGNKTGRVAAVNSFSSRSGMSALLTVCQPEEFVLTGSHTASLAGLQAGEVDVAAIDAVTWKILERDAPGCLAGIKQVERTPAALAPPFVVRRGVPQDVVLDGLQAAARATSAAAARQALCLQSIRPVCRSDYAPVLAEYRAVADYSPKPIESLLTGM